MAKSKKIDVKNVMVQEDEKGILNIQGFEGEEIPFENLTFEIREMINLGKPLNIKISKGRKSKGGAERKPIYKYKCNSCQKEIKSNEDSLIVKCMDCDCEYQKVEK